MTATNSVFLIVKLLVILMTSVSAQLLDLNSATVTTSFGRIRGFTQDIGDGKSVLSFIGIPFAAPPTRGNRFRVSVKSVDPVLHLPVFSSSSSLPESKS